MKWHAHAPEAGMGAVRFSLGRTSTAEEIIAILEMAACLR